MSRFIQFHNEIIELINPHPTFQPKVVNNGPQDKWPRKNVKYSVISIHKGKYAGVSTWNTEK